VKATNGAMMRLAMAIVVRVFAGRANKASQISQSPMPTIS
jgi:hypothetical protein